MNEAAEPAIDAEKVDALAAALKSALPIAAKAAGEAIEKNPKLKDQVEKLGQEGEEQNEAFGVLGTIALILSAGKATSLIGSFLQYVSRTKLAKAIGIGEKEYAVLTKDKGVLSNLGRWLEEGGDKYTHKIEDVVEIALSAIPSVEFQNWFSNLKPQHRERVKKLTLMTILIGLAFHGGTAAWSAFKEGHLTHAATEGSLTGVKATEITSIASETLEGITTFFSAAADVAQDASDITQEVAHIAEEITEEIA